MSYRNARARYKSARLAEAEIKSGILPELQALRDLVEENHRLRVRIDWWKRIGSKRTIPWSRRIIYLPQPPPAPTA